MRSMVVRMTLTPSTVTGAPSRYWPISVSAAWASLASRVQAEEAARAFDRVDQPEDGVEHLGIVGVLLEAHELDVELDQGPRRFRSGIRPTARPLPTPGRARNETAPKPRLAPLRGYSVNSGLRFVDQTKFRLGGGGFRRSGGLELDLPVVGLGRHAHARGGGHAARVIRLDRMGIDRHAVAAEQQASYLVVELAASPLA